MGLSSVYFVKNQSFHHKSIISSHGPMWVSSRLAFSWINIGISHISCLSILPTNLNKHIANIIMEKTNLFWDKYHFLFLVFQSSDRTTKLVSNVNFPGRQFYLQTSVTIALAPIRCRHRNQQQPITAWAPISWYDDVMHAPFVYLSY